MSHIKYLNNELCINIQPEEIWGKERESFDLSISFSLFISKNRLNNNNIIIEVVIDVTVLLLFLHNLINYCYYYYYYIHQYYYNLKRK